MFPYSLEPALDRARLSGWCVSLVQRPVTPRSHRSGVSHRALVRGVFIGMTIRMALEMVRTREEALDSSWYPPFVQQGCGQSHPEVDCALCCVCGRVAEDEVCGLSRGTESRTSF